MDTYVKILTLMEKHLSARVNTGLLTLMEEATAVVEDRLEIWDVETGEQLASLALHISDVIFSGDGKTLAITGSGGVFCLGHRYTAGNWRV